MNIRAGGRGRNNSSNPLPAPGPWLMNLSSIRENTQLAMQTLVSHKFRAALTILGVFIGVLGIVAMAAVLNGFRQTVHDQAESFGTRNVYIWRYPFIMTSRPPAEVLNRKPLSLEDAQA